MSPNEITEARIDELKAEIDRMKEEAQQLLDDLEMCKKLLAAHERL